MFEFGWDPPMVVPAIPSKKQELVGMPENCHPQTVSQFGSNLYHNLSQ